LRTFSVDFCIG